MDVPADFPEQCRFVMETLGTHAFEGAAKSWFAEMLLNQLRKPVIDTTGLKAKYDFMAQWSWDEGQEAVSAAAAALVSAVQWELGLKLERKNSGGVARMALGCPQSYNSSASLGARQNFEIRLGV